MLSIHAPPTPIILYAAPITEHYRSSIKGYRSSRGMYEFTICNSNHLPGGSEAEAAAAAAAATDVEFDFLM